MATPLKPQAPIVNSMAILRLNQERVINMQRIVTVTTPQFMQDQVDAIHRDATAVVHTIDQKTWVTLAGWLDPAHAVVQCRRTGLTIKINRKDKVTAALLPTSDNFPKATLLYTLASTTSTPQQKHQKLETHLNIDGGSLLLDLALKADSYAEVFDGMTAEKPDIRVEIEFAHPCQVQVHVKAPTPTPPTPPHPPTPPTPHPRPPIAVGTGNGMMRKVQRVQPAPRAAVPIKAAPLTATPVTHTVTPVSAMMIRTRTPNWVIVKPPPPANNTISYRDEVLTGPKISIPIAHAQTETDVFPDLHPHTQSGWGQVPKNPNLHYLDSDSADTFFYLPTAFKLGCYSDVAAGPAASRLPLQVELYPDPDGKERIKATLVALPCIDDKEREDLRNHLCQEVLKQSQPFVNLEMKSGLEASFTAEGFNAGTAKGQQSLPSDITFLPVEVVPDQRLVLRFDMPAESYSIFCPIMRNFGIFGKVELADRGKGPDGVITTLLAAEIDVRLQLKDLVTNQLQVEHIPPEVPTATPSGTEAAPPPAAPAGTLKLKNLLDFPVAPSSVTVHYLNVASHSHLVFEAEKVSMILPNNGQLPPQSDPNSTVTFPTKPQQILAWDATVVETGQLKVQGGTPQEWLDRVNRDPSLQPHDIQQQLHLSILAAIRDRVQFMRLYLFKDGDPKVRSFMQLAPDAPAPKLKIPVSLAELAVEGGLRNFSVEYETVASDGNLSLPQRVAINPDFTLLVIQPIVETPKSIFTVDYVGGDGIHGTQELDHKGAAELIDKLRSQGGHWSFSVKEPKAATTTTDTTSDATKTGTTTTGATTTGTTTTGTTTTTGDASATTKIGTSTTTPGPDVTVVTYLAALALQDGSLVNVFVVLKPPTDDLGQQSSFVLDAKNCAPFNWQPQGFVAPPFRYEITYVYKENQVKKTSGTSATPALVLEPPPLT